MFRIFLSNNHDQPYNQQKTQKPGSLMIGLGVVFVIFGIVILFFPEILVVLVSASFILLGALLYSIGSFLRKRK